MDSRSGTLLTRRQLIFGAAVGSAGVAAGFGVAASTYRERTVVAGEVPSAADIGFCADMSAHHVQALAMCQRVLGADTGDSVEAAAAEVIQTQAIEVGQMRAWLADWGQSTAPPESTMAWMGHSGMTLAMMPGYATDDELNELSTATGMAKGRLWVELMTAHHRGGVEMATPQRRRLRARCCSAMPSTATRSTAATG